MWITTLVPSCVWNCLVQIRYVKLATSHAEVVSRFARPRFVLENLMSAFIKRWGREELSSWARRARDSGPSDSNAKRLFRRLDSGKIHVNPLACRESGDGSELSERVTGIGPAYSAWEAKVPPQHFARVAQLTTYRYSPIVHIHFSQHRSQLRNNRRNSPKILHVPATQLSRNNPVFTGFSLHRAETLVVSNLLGKLMFCH